MSREIGLTRGKVTVVDDEDYGFLSRFKWHYMPPPRGKVGGGYAGCGAHNTTRYMHRVIMLSPPLGMDVDHINGDGLDNRRANLRVVSHQQNCCHRTRMNTRNSSGVSGVGYEALTSRWRAYIDDGRRIWLGSFRTKEEAVAARRVAEEEHFGPLSRGTG